MEEDNLKFALISESDPSPTSARKKHTATIENDAKLLVAMRAGQSRALREFYVRFQPVLLDQAYKTGVPSEVREEVVSEFLGDIAIKLIDAESVPHSLAGYVITAFRHTVVSAYRRQGRAESYQLDASEEMMTGESAVTTLCSEYSLRMVQGEAVATGEMRVTSAMLERFADRLVQGLSTPDQELLAWLGEHVPATVIAGWRGTTLNAVKVKVSRLRARLRVEAGKYLNEMNGDVRKELERFLRRAGVVVSPMPIVKTVTHGQGSDALNRLSLLGHGTMDIDYPSPYGVEDV